VVLDAHEREPALICNPHKLAIAVERIGIGDDRDPDFERSRVHGYRALLSACAASFGECISPSVA
jgi:hypothetical protein